ncbi:hypothetical protein GCM10025868_00730 [Angustibacter aerolatus]|uniref:Uncharacterized protein n=1 Tax=Angustibacter aerolatus TaxID=1162965 RepID=A0ABQ6J9G4_9ACTN|nr:hypothetical protein [Angustibacter aerolatus]GMA84823.1 hypothetical protein GCM10025868_00730 [Angustibacter aerolatus]
MSDRADTAQTPSAAEAEVADLCRDLLRIDTSNYGDGSGPGSAPRPSTSWGC